jgi:RHS repeat-associated protein
MTLASKSATDGGAATATVSYSYDALGNRVRRQAWDAASGATTTTSYGYDGWDTAKPDAVGAENFDAWADLDGSGALNTRRLFGPGFDEPAARVRPGGALAWYGADRLGSVRQVFANSGSITATSDFVAYGNLTAGGLADRYGYTGREWDSTLGLYDYRARLYSPTTGRFYGEDPTGFAAGDPNLARYVGNSPTNGTDPSGLRNWLGRMWDEAVMVGGYVVNNPIMAPVEAAKGAAHGLEEVGRGAVDAANEADALANDVGNAAYSLGSRALGQGPQPFDLQSQTLRGYDAAVKRGDGSHAGYLGNAMADGASFGLKPLGQSLAEGVRTGDYTRYQRTAGGFGGGVAFGEAGGMVSRGVGNGVSKVFGKGKGGLPGGTPTASESVASPCGTGRGIVSEAQARGTKPNYSNYGGEFDGSYDLPNSSGRPVPPGSEAPGKPYTTLSEAQAAHSAKGIPIESTAPVPIPKRTVGKPTNYSGDKAGLTYEWTEGGYKYTARLHEATQGAPPGSPISWVVERAKPGQAGSKKLGIPQVDRVEQVLVPDGAGGTKWISRGDWEKLKQGHTAGTLTPTEQQLLKGGHFDVPSQ